MATLLLWLLLCPGSFAVIGGAGWKVAKMVRARRHQAERAAAPIAHHVAERTAAVRVGGFHACELEACGLTMPHPCHDIRCWRRSAGSCQPIHSIAGGRRS